jgi:hypothetical protein
MREAGAPNTEGVARKLQHTMCVASLPIAQGRRRGVRRTRLICKVWCVG